MTNLKSSFAHTCRRVSLVLNAHTHVFIEYKVRLGNKAFIFTPVPEVGGTVHLSPIAYFDAPDSFVRVLLCRASKAMCEFGYENNSSDLFELFKSLLETKIKFEIAPGVYAHAKPIIDPGSVIKHLSSRNCLLSVVFSTDSKDSMINLAKTLGMYESIYSYMDLDFKDAMVALDRPSIELVVFNSVADPNFTLSSIDVVPEVWYEDPTLMESDGKLYWLQELGALVLSKCDTNFTTIIKRGLRSVVSTSIESSNEPGMPLVSLLPLANGYVVPIFIITGQPIGALPSSVQKIDKLTDFKNKKLKYTYLIIGKSVKLNEHLVSDYSQQIEMCKQSSVIRDGAEYLNGYDINELFCSSPSIMHPILTSTRSVVGKVGIEFLQTRYRRILNSLENLHTDMYMDEGDEIEIITDIKQNDIELEPVIGTDQLQEQDFHNIKNFVTVSTCDVFSPEAMAELLDGSAPIFINKDYKSNFGNLIDITSPSETVFH